MPNKDSFTFSDKLKKSKSLPLSKRIPSRVGGDGKAKRTLIQRAQRDLPFIIVAVAALLLLPLLSRHGGTDGAGFEGSGYDDFVGQSLYDYPSSGDGEIVPSTGYRDPMDYIITNRSGMDTPSLSDSYDSEDPSLYISRAQDSYADSKPQREIYKDVAKPGIRNAVQRKATAIGAFRNRAMSFGGSTSGLSRNLAIGGAPTTAGAAAARVGVRPVALQPLTSGGKGRVLTGEGLYAEAARSLGALNQGSAKQALFEAQLRDVDGTPLGAPGDSRRAAARIGSQGRVPDHKFGYTNERPWWWDMMNERSQKMWELWNYNWQKALSDSLIKVSTNLAMCLLTGSQDGSVEKFLGVKGGSKDICCLVDGKEICAGDIGDYTSSTSGSGDSKETTNNSFSSIQAFCESHESKVYVSESGAKNFLQARLECMGLKAGKMAWASGTNYAASCANVNKTPMVYKASARRKADGKVRSGKQEKVVVYVKAKPRDKSVDTGTKDNEFVIALEKTNEFTLSQSQLEAINKNCEITRVGSFAAKNSKRKIGKKVGQYNDLNDDSDSKKVKEDDDAIEKRIAELESELRRTNNEKERTELNRELTLLKKGRYTPEAESENAEEEENNETEAMINSYVRGQVAAQYNYCTGGNTKPAKFIDEDDIMKDLRVKAEINDVCPIWYSEGTINDRTVNGLTCNTQQSGVDFVEIDKLSRSTFSVTVNNPKDYIYAIFLEEVQSAQDQNGKSGVIVKHYVKDTAEETSSGNDMVHSNVTMGEDGRITSATYTVPYYRAGKAPESTQSNTVGSVPGNGKVFWLMTNKETPIVKAGHVFEGKVLSEINAEDLIGPTAGHKEGECFYSWGCNGSECPDKAPIATLCKDGEKIYRASKYNDYYFKHNTTPMTEQEINDYAKSHAEYDIGAFKNKLPSCNSICKHKEGVYGILGGTDEEKALQLELDSSIVAQEILNNCPSCNPQEDNSTPEEAALARNDENNYEHDRYFNSKLDLGNCEFTINSQFAVNRFMVFKNDSKVKAEIAGKFSNHEMIKCLTRIGGVTLNIEGSASASGDDPSKNQALSEARATRVAEEIIVFMKQHINLKNLRICYKYNDGYGTKEGWTTDETAGGENASGHDLETESEKAYLEGFKKAHPEGNCVQTNDEIYFADQEMQRQELVGKVREVQLTTAVKKFIDSKNNSGTEYYECVRRSTPQDIRACIDRATEKDAKNIPDTWTEEDKASYEEYNQALNTLKYFINATYLPALERISYLEIYIQGKGVDSRSKGAEEEYQSIKGWVTVPSKQ